MVKKFYKSPYALFGFLIAWAIYVLYISPKNTSLTGFLIYGAFGMLGGYLIELLKTKKRRKR